ncbi:response regulator [Parasegetibacter sp. NRK P23]|uniref:response regulator n=1 Tax=Parasegetibacter sp. NRK P23 TaxID=2942999 RepID=UPI002043929F|nr:response regulator [Parasegetibacter sp. NRK P23]MCM5530046.1 response regulator [Parasegetibacter sp. NRK P23]
MQFAKATFQRNLLIGFGLSLLLLIVSSIASYLSITNLLESARLVNHTNEVIKKLEVIPSVLKDAETAQRGYLLTGEETFLEPFKGTYDQLLNQLDEVRVTTSDNPLQQQSVEALAGLVKSRMKMLEQLIRNKKNGVTVSVDDLRKGKEYMDAARTEVEIMERREQELLQERTKEMNRLAGYTPVVIVVAAILALLITIMFYARVKADFDQRIILQKALQDKDQEIQDRIESIRAIADKVSAGDYSVRVSDAAGDNLGTLAGNLNKMAASLETSFKRISDNEWVQTGIAKMNNTMIAEEMLEALSDRIVEYVALYTGSQVGALYVKERESLHFYAGYAYHENSSRAVYHVGEGMVGQAARTGERILLEAIPEEQVAVSFATGDVKPKNIVLVPLKQGYHIKGVLELGSVHPFSERTLSFLEAIAEDLGTAIASAQNRQRLQELLEETQSQAEELQSQHSELENLNTELEAQAQKLQASEEELKVQQEELMQTNQELEERSRLLEERNMLIAERNMEIQTKAEQLELSTKYKSEFLANMSHELRTPLNSILLLSRLMSENNNGNLSPEDVEYAKVIQSAGNGLLSLIDEILDLSKIESGKMELEYGRVAVSDIVRDMRALFEPVAQEKGLELKLTIQQGVPSALETDKMRLEQILRNLLSNALKFTAQGYVHMDVFRPTDESNYIGISVKDTGIGIPKEKQHLIFEAFQQADGSTRRKYGGTGLGLSISRELARLLGGEIQLHSNVDQGSEFVVYVPLEKAQTAALPPAPKKVAEVQPEQEAEQKTVTVDPYISPSIPEAIPDDRNQIVPGDNVILIVEDDTNFAFSLLEYARKNKYKGVLSVRGDEAVPLAITYKPRGILLDIQLPVKSGWEVMEELKNNPQTRHIPVHIMSSHTVRRESLLTGAVDFINKPVAFEKINEIFGKIEEVLSRDPKKVLIVEENPKHARALAYFLESFQVNAEISSDVNESIDALTRRNIDCVILDMGVPDKHAYNTLDEVKRTPGLEQLPIIVFTGKSLSRSEELRIRQYADSIVVKTAHSYQRILDEVSLFLHMVEEHRRPEEKKYMRLGGLNEVLSNKKVLVADDDVRNIFSLTKTLEQYGMSVISAVDGKEALQQLDAHPDVNIILMDMMMPEMDGYESIARIRKNPRYKNLPILAVTAKAMTGDREKCIKAGASDYITKPVDIDQLLSLLRVWLYD